MPTTNLISEPIPANAVLAKPLCVSKCSVDFSAVLNQSPASNATWLSLFPIVTQVIKHFLQLPHPLLFLNATHWQAALAVLKGSYPDNTKSLALQNYNQQTLFGRLNLTKQDSFDFQPGVIEKLDSGILTLHISPLLSSPELWFLLKSFLINKTLPPTSAVNANKYKGSYSDAPVKKIQTKIVLVCTRYQLDELQLLDPEYHQVDALFTELSGSIAVNDKNIHALKIYCQQLINDLKLQPLTDPAFSLLFNYLSQATEHQKKLLFSPAFIEELLRYAQIFAPKNQPLEATHLQQAFDIQMKPRSLAQDFSEQALVEKQVNIQLAESVIGQINGLAVVELLGYPTEFGEIFRLSASEMIGDGEIVDVERKVELAGNIHAKSFLVVQGYVNHFFTHVQNFPLSCNVVFEQSYQESDGDSASLATLLAVTSCYALQPIKQDLFVTGALDQHGNVLPIGGINQKIQAVTRLFDLGLLDSSVCILIPRANQINLTLDPQTLQLIKQKKINIYPISHCEEAFPYALQCSFKDVLSLINQRIDFLQKNDLDDSGKSLLSRCISLFR
ncbi:ATP-dependent protease La [Psychromonas sp. CNPT3]|uniref:S16 family serine protease n=1 Tax=Psychromonas sp. CNPT3 TaxID=314282 RepID=UPI0002C11FEE|nr:S16 family serine protease [Psychromonas sp. CNPT3]AGH81128.1 ATP-dependent protease La [Psychromonas sp. CNPT3]